MQNSECDDECSKCDDEIHFIVGLITEISERHENYAEQTLK